jgi:hypothetical protein
MKGAQASEVLAPRYQLRGSRTAGISQPQSAAEQIPRPYSRAEESARELNGDFGMTEPLRLRTAYMRLSTLVSG